MEYSENGGYIRQFKHLKVDMEQKYNRSCYLRADVSKYRPEVYKSEKSKNLKKIHNVALGKLLT